MDIFPAEIIAFVTFQTQRSLVILDRQQELPGSAMSLMTAQAIPLGHRFMDNLAGRQEIDRLRRLQRRLEQASRSLAVRTPEHRLADCRFGLERLSHRLLHACRQQQQRRRHALDLLAGKLDACSPLGILRRGYAVVEKLPERRPVVDAGELQNGDRSSAVQCPGAGGKGSGSDG